MSVKRMLGTFPVFGSEAKLGKLQDVNGNVLPSKSFPSFYTSNVEAYEKGFKEITPEVLNGALHHVTSAVSYLYKHGVPEFSLNVAYPKGAIVTFAGNLYVSLTDENIKHVSQSSHWGKFVFEHSRYEYKPTEKQDDNLPIGTILTVPVSVKKDGYIDYVEGHSFNGAMYPELYHALGTNEFAVTNQTAHSELPIGSMVHVLSTAKVPDGWIEWDTSYGSLRKYPELLNELQRVVSRLPLGEAKDYWLSALAKQSLPIFEGGDLYLGLGELGLYTKDTIKQQQLVSAPVVLDHSNTLNPLGVARCPVESETLPAVSNPDVAVERTANTSYVVVGQPVESYNNVAVDKKGFVTHVGNGNVTAPKTLHTRLLVKAVNQRPSSISSTHKQIIKAYTLGD